MNVKRNGKVRRGGLTKKDHIKYWVDIARRDWLAIRKMLECRSYMHALFFMHLVLEKLLKAHWVKDNEGNHPPRTHDLIKISNQITLKLTEPEIKFLEKMNDFQLEGRYPDHRDTLFIVYKRKKTYAIFVYVNAIRKCLLRELQ